jgi:predicted transcriptional regulator
MAAIYPTAAGGVAAHGWSASLPLPPATRAPMSGTTAISIYAGAWDALRPLLRTADGGERAAEWPLPVEGPLADLDEALRKGMPGLAFVNAREAAEGVMRLAWTFLLHETLNWVPSVDSLQALPDATRAAVGAVLDSATVGQFTFGGACAVAGESPGGGIAAPLATLAPLLAAHGPEAIAPAWHAALAAQPVLRDAVRALWQWRNHRFAHGFVGDADAYAALFDARLTDRHDWRDLRAASTTGSPFPALLALLEAAAPWLSATTAATRALGWPDLATARAWSSTPTPTPSPDPVAWLGGPRPLYLWNRATARGVRGIDTLRGEELEFALPPRYEALARAARAALDPSPILFVARWGPGSGERLLDDPRRVDTKALRAAVLQALDTGHRRVAVTGPAGAGKTYLTRDVGDALTHAGRLVLRVAAGASGAMDSGRLPRLIQNALEPHSLRAVIVDEAETGLEEAVRAERDSRGAIARWWRALAHANPSRRFVLVLDGLDEWHASGGVGPEVLPPTEGPGADAFAVVFGFRSAAQVAPWLRPVLEDIPADATVDVQSWLLSHAGGELLSRYLASKHPAVPEARRVDVISRAQGRFLWVFHYARGFAAGFLEAAEPLAQWPAPEDFYERYLVWLEARMGQAPGYVRCLRRTLLTLSLARIPINDPTLAWLWEVDGARDGEVPEGWLDWFEPVLADLQDFLVRGPVALDATDEAEQRAALVTVDDAKRQSRHAVCRGLAHTSLYDYLTGPALAESWQAERAATAKTLTERVADALFAESPGAITNEAPRRARAVSAPVRFAEQLFWSLQGAVDQDTSRLEPYMARFRALLPQEDAVTTGHLGHWIHACADGAALFDLCSPDSPTFPRFAMRFEQGRLLNHARRFAEATATLVDARDLACALARLPQDRPPSAAELSEALARDPGAVREVAIALNTLGVALRSMQKAGEAVAVHQQELVLKSALARLPQDRPPSAAELSEALARDPGAVRSVAIALNTLGVALESMQKAGEAVAVHQQELVLKSALARLPQDRPPSAAELSEALARDPGAVREVAIALNTLGVALRSMQKAGEAVAVHQQELVLKSALARLPQDRPPSAAELSEALARDPGAVRSVAIALNTLGVALRSMQKAGEAVAVHQQELVLNRALARLPQDRPPSAAELSEALARDPGAVRSVAIALNTLGVALESMQKAGEAVAVHQQELVLKSALAQLPQDRPPSAAELSEALARDPGAVREVAIALNTLGVALRSMQKAGEAVAVHQQELVLKSALARLPQDRPPSAAELSEALARDPGAVRSVAIALNTLGVALRSMQKAGEAVAVHQQELVLKSALAQLPQDRPPSAAELSEALARDPGAVREVAIALNTLGVALESMQKAGEAVAVHQQELVLNRALARLPQDRPPSAAELSEALARDPGAVRSVAIALNTLGVALRSMQKAGEAVAVHQQELVLKSALARLPQDRPPSAAELSEALARDPGAVRSVAIAWYTLAQALAGAGETAGGVEASERAVHLMRGLARVGAWARFSDLVECAAVGPVQVFELGQIAMGHVAAMDGAGRPEAERLECRAEALWAFGAAAVIGLDAALPYVQHLLGEVVPRAGALKAQAVLADCQELIRELQKRHA